MAKQPGTKEGGLHSRLQVIIIVAFFVGVALLLRTVLPYPAIFTDGWIKFSGSDAYYQMYLVDSLAHNFPHFSSFNPYFIYPGGASVGSVHFFNWLLAGIIWVVSLGSPTPHTIDVVGVYFPAILAALTIIPVYFIGRELFGRWAGIISAGLIAILPGEFMGRSALGFTDQHIAETLFTTSAVMFFIMAIKTASRRELTFSHLYRRDWSVITRPLVYSLLAGIFLGVYFLTWLGALLFAFILSLYFIIQFTIDHIKHKSTDYLCIVGVVVFFIALLMFLPVSPGIFYTVPLVIALFIPPALSLISGLLTHFKLSPAYYPLALIGLGTVGAGIFFAISPSLFSAMLDVFRSTFIPSGVSLTTVEMQPLLFLGGNFTLGVVWGNYTTILLLGLIALIVLIWAVVRQGDAGKSILVVWSLVILAATLGQRRFGYYLAVNVALLTGYLAIIIYYLISLFIEYLGGKNPGYIRGRILDYAGYQTQPFVQTPGAAAKEVGRARSAKNIASDSNFATRPLNMALGVLFVFFLAFFPNIIPAIKTAGGAPYVPSDAWQSSLLWMKDNTPDPFGNPDFYYELHQSPPPGEKYVYPDSAYGVLAWWDYGYWITRIAHRIPNANPSQATVANTNVARIFTAQDETSADGLVRELGSSYVIIDEDTVTGKFWAIANWAGRSENEFFDIFFIPQETGLTPIRLLYPEYYRSLVVRLYNFDGKAVAAGTSFVISYEDRLNSQDEVYKHVTSVEQFTSYEDALEYLSLQSSSNYRLVSNDPFSSPVPLEALEHYRLVHSSELYTIPSDDRAIPSVKIFEYIE